MTPIYFLKNDETVLEIHRPYDVSLYVMVAMYLNKIHGLYAISTSLKTYQLTADL